MSTFSFARFVGGKFCGVSRITASSASAAVEKLSEGFTGVWLFINEIKSS